MSSPIKSRIQRLKYYRPLHPHTVSTKKPWRLKSYKFNIAGHLQFELKVRKFKTSPENRSKKLKQFVVRVSLFKIKELALYYKYLPAQKKHNYPKKILHSVKFSTVMMIVGFVGITFFSLRIAGVGQTDPPIAVAKSEATAQEVEQATEPKVEKTLPKSIPVQVDIPAIDVSAGIQNVGLLENGSIETPELFSNLVGWYQFGPTPGELGPAVLVGHVDTYKGPSVFWSLGKLQINDIITVRREDGTVAQFSVTKIQQYAQDSFPTEEVYGNINHAGLRVITCGGTFDYITGRYSHNTIVFATLIL